MSSDQINKEKKHFTDSKSSRNVMYGFHLVEGQSCHVMEDYLVSQFKRVGENELGLFAIFDGHVSHLVPGYLQSHLFDNIITEPDFWTDPMNAVRKAYRETDMKFLEQSSRELSKGGSTAVSAILINREKLVVGNVGDSRAVICTKGKARQISVDHDASSGRKEVEDKGGFVLSYPGDVPRVDGELAMTRAFGDRGLKMHLSSEPNVTVEMISDDTEFVILASDGIWLVMSNQESVDSIKHITDAKAAAKHLIEEALARKSTDDISCIVIRFPRTAWSIYVQCCNLVNIHVMVGLPVSVVLSFKCQCLSGLRPLYCIFILSLRSVSS